MFALLHEDPPDHYPMMDDIWRQQNEETDFFRWVVDEANNQLECEDLLFSEFRVESNNTSCTYTSQCTIDFIQDSNSYNSDIMTCETPETDFTFYDESDHHQIELLRRPGRPKTMLPDIKCCVKKTGKLWEFLRNLLLDKNTCPSLIKWDDYSEGTFKFVQSEKVAQLWGNRKNNTKMNYEKLSRAMRYYYRSKVLLPVAGKRLVYKFGPQATGWKTDNPIL